MSEVRQFLGTILVVRSTLMINVLEPSLMRVLKSINPTQPAYRLKSIQTSVDRAVSPRRFFIFVCRMAHCFTG